MAFWVTYDHVGKLILANVVWFVGSALPVLLGWVAWIAGNGPIRIFVALPLLVFGLGVALPVLTAGLAHMAKVLIDTRDGSVGDMFRGARLYARRAALIGLVFLLASVSLATSIWFYATKLHSSVPWLGYGISALAAWGLAFVLLASLLVMPALVQKKDGPFATMKLAGLLVLANPLFTAGLGIQVAGLTVVALVLSPVFPLLYGALATVLGSSAYEMLARKYALAGIEQGIAQPEGTRPPPVDEQDDYLNRGFRDFLFPWKG